MFNPGDKVRRIDNKGSTGNKAILENIYTVLKQNNSERLTLVEFEDMTWFIDNFELVKEELVKEESYNIF